MLAGRWCFNRVVDAPERHPSSVLYPFSHFLQPRETLSGSTFTLQSIGFRFVGLLK